MSQSFEILSVLVCVVDKGIRVNLISNRISAVKGSNVHQKYD